MRGHLALVRGNNAEAMVAFESSVVLIPFDLRPRMPALGQLVNCLARAETLRAPGRALEAKQWNASTLNGPAPSSVPYRAIP